MILAFFIFTKRVLYVQKTCSTRLAEVCRAS